jgi:hypothetical protein
MNRVKSGSLRKEGALFRHYRHLFESYADVDVWKNELMDRQSHIAVVGSANIDLITYTDDFPRPGETIFGREFSLGFGGKGANQAVAACLCGAKVSMVARVGDDLFGPATIENFISRGIDASRVLVTPGVSSGWRRSLLKVPDRIASGW